MSQRLYLPREQVFTDLGTIGAGWKLNSYEMGTTTPKATYSNTALSVANTNPVISDSAGRLGDMFIDDAKTYKLVLTDENNVTKWTADPVDPKTFSLDDFDPRPTSFWGTTGGTSTAYTLISDPIVTAYSSTQTGFFACHLDCGADPTIAIDGLNALVFKKYNGSGSKVSLIALDIVSGQTYSFRNDGTDIVIFNPEHPANLPANTDLWRGLTYLPKQITISNGTDTDHDIDSTAGNFQFSDGSGQATITALTKELDATWAAGTNNGGLFTGTVALDTTYHYFAIYNPTTGVSDAGFDTSITAANAPAGFTKRSEIITSVITDASSNIINGTYIFDKSGYYFNFPTPVEDLSLTTLSITKVDHRLTVPEGVLSWARLNVHLNRSVQVAVLLFGSGDDDVAPTISNSTVYVDSTSAVQKNDYPILADNGLISYRSGSVTVTRFTIHTKGWRYNY